jgi:hypothetical protein
LPARGTGAAVEGHLMREGQRPRASHLARVSETLTVALCLLGLAAPPASAADSTLAPDRSPPPLAPAGSQTPRPDPAPQASQPSRSSAPASHTAPSINTPLRVTSVPPDGSHVAATSPPAAQLPSSRATGPRRAQVTGTAYGTRKARARVPHKQVPPPAAGSAVVSLASGRGDGILMLFASLACALLAASSLTLLRLLRRHGGSWPEGRTS